MPHRLDDGEGHPVPPEIIRESEYRQLFLRVAQSHFFVFTVFLHSACQRPQALLLSLVCKEAHAWIIRVLYRTVTFSSRHDLLLFESSITRRPELGRHIRSLYIGAIAKVDSVTNFTETFEWKADCIASVRRLLINGRNLERLALVNLPPSDWHPIEECLPPRLKTLAVGPAHGLLGLNVTHHTLESFYYADTILQSAELKRISMLPALAEFRWRSPLRFDDVVYKQLKILLSSPSLQNLHITLYGTCEDARAFYKDEFDELNADSRLTIVCDPGYEDNREWIPNFHREWREVEA